VRILLDTHALVWYVDQDHLLSPAAHAAITDPANTLLLSAGSIWELAIKVGLNKLSLSLPYRTWIDQAMVDLGVTILPITAGYADIQMTLPYHHRDPFDRLLAAQAKVGNVSLVSTDPIFSQYGISCIW
jgi:PIN domain nuclease of toxin-antitoxin system